VRTVHLLGLALALLAAAPGCAGQRVSGGAAPAEPAKKATPQPPPPPLMPDDPRSLRLAKIARMLEAWDESQGTGDERRAAAFAAHLKQEVDAGSEDVRAAFRGETGDEGRYLATMALGFASAPDATGLLVERLKDDDPRLVANALIALKLRADPSTPLIPVARHVGSGSKDVRRYAPLALAHVLDARRRAGVAPDVAVETRVGPMLAKQAEDRDALSRLHAARALGELSIPGAGPTLVKLVRDEHDRVRMGAAQALAGRGEPEGFADVVKLLDQATAEEKPVIAQILFLYAERLTGTPLTEAEKEKLGMSPIAWLRWNAARIKAAPTPPAQVTPARPG
jgi:HEAT repeat protein